MQYIYIPPAQFSFYLHLKIPSISEQIVNSLEFRFHPFPSELPHISNDFPNIKKQFDDYFLKQSAHLDIFHELNAKTAFQRRVLQALQNISYGETSTYGDFAKSIGTHPRAIGQALKSNPLPLIYPCHRVLSKTGLGGFMGQAKGERCDIKQQLLSLEQNSAR